MCSVCGAMRPILQKKIDGKYDNQWRLFSIREDSFNHLFFTCEWFRVTEKSDSYWPADMTVCESCLRVPIINNKILFSPNVDWRIEDIANGLYYRFSHLKAFI